MPHVRGHAGLGNTVEPVHVVLVPARYPRRAHRCQEHQQEIIQDVIHNLPAASGYCDSKGLFAARKGVMHETQRKQVRDVQMEDIYIGNGVSELIVMSMQALLNNGDEVLVPAPDYPLWTAAVSLSGGTPRHYLCDEGAGWLPDFADIRGKIGPSTRAIVLINPNNPTGALSPDDLLREIIGIARQHQLIIFADEIYDNVLYDGATHTSVKIRFARPDWQILPTVQMRT